VKSSVAERLLGTAAKRRFPLDSVVDSVAYYTANYATQYSTLTSSALACGGLKLPWLAQPTLPFFTMMI
jgi:hypothetical protein